MPLGFSGRTILGAADLAVDGLFLEDSSGYVLLETGDFLLLE